MGGKPLGSMNFLSSREEITYFHTNHPLVYIVSSNNSYKNICTTVLVSTIPTVERKITHKNDNNLSNSHGGRSFGILLL